MKRKNIVSIISYLLAVLFAYAAIAKLLDFSTFRLELSQAPLIGKWPLLFACTVPLIEITTVLALLSTHYRLSGLYSSAALMTAFTVYIAILLNSQGPVTCDCGGLLEQMDLGTHLWFNAGFLFLALAGLVLERRTGGRASPTLSPKT